MTALTIDEFDLLLKPLFLTFLERYGQRGLSQNQIKKCRLVPNLAATCVGSGFGLFVKSDLIVHRHAALHLGAAKRLLFSVAPAG
jgi:hypothetical protein